jgi:hypothetical protein
MRVGMLACGRGVDVHANGLRQESEAVSEPVTGAVTCGSVVEGAGSKVGGRVGARCGGDWQDDLH